MALVDTAEIGRKGGKARAENLSPEERSQSAREAATARWAQVKAAKKQVGRKKLAGGKK